MEHVGSTIGLRVVLAALSTLVVAALRLMVNRLHRHDTAGHV